MGDPRGHASQRQGTLESTEARAASSYYGSLICDGLLHLPSLVARVGRHVCLRRRSAILVNKAIFAVRHKYLPVHAFLFVLFPIMLMRAILASSIGSLDNPWRNVHSLQNAASSAASCNQESAGIVGKMQAKRQVQVPRPRINSNHHNINSRLIINTNSPRDFARMPLIMVCFLVAGFDQRFNVLLFLFEVCSL